MSIGIHWAEHEYVSHLFVFFRGCNSKLVPVSSEVNVSLHHIRKRHERDITLAISSMLESDYS